MIAQLCGDSVAERSSRPHPGQSHDSIHLWAFPGSSFYSSSSVMSSTESALGKLFDVDSSPLPPPRQVHGQVDHRARLKHGNHPSKLETCRSHLAVVLLVKMFFFASALSRAWESCLCLH